MSDIIITNGLNISFEIITLALVAMGLAITLGLLGVLNLAHGEFIMIGGFCSFVVHQQGLPFIVAIPFAILVAIIIAWPVEKFLIRPLYKRPFDTILATWGLSLLLRELAKYLFGRGYNSVSLPVSGTVNVLGADYPIYQLIVMLVAIILLTALISWFLLSTTGKRIKAMINNYELAGAVGIRADMLARNSFILGVCLGSIAGVLLSPIVTVHPGMGIDYVLKSFFVLIIGGLGHILALIAGAAVIGGSEAIVSALFDRTAGYSFVLIVALIFLWRKPGGLVNR